MVVFCCNTCGSSIKKTQVPRHTTCEAADRRDLSCMDCHKDFRGDEYKKHTKCVSEKEKYADKTSKASTNTINKNEKKQMAWVDTVKATVVKAGKTIDPSSQNLLQALAKLENVPRKKAKFVNFVRNITRKRFNSQIIDKVWTLLENQWKLEKEKVALIIPSNQKSVVLNQQGTVQNTTTNEIPEKTDVEGKKKKKDKKKRESASSVGQDIEILTEIVNEDADNGEKKEKKKSITKKRKRDSDLQTDQVSEPETDELNNTTANEDDGDDKKKKKRKRESASLENDEIFTILNRTHDTTVGGEDKEKKKSKKKRKSQANDDEQSYIQNDTTQDITMNENDGDDKKRRPSQRRSGRVTVKYCK